MTTYTIWGNTYQLTEHAHADRAERMEFIRTNIGYGFPIAEQIIDKGHRNGAERHVLTHTGIIVVFNARSGKLVTAMIARLGQAYRYTDRLPDNTVERIRNHVAHGWNEIFNS